MSGQENKKEEFEKVALPYMESLYYAALHMMRSKEKAEDLVQETYLRAYQAFDSFRKGTNCKAWLFKILRNSFINKYRKEKKSPDTTSFTEIEDFNLYNQLTKDSPAIKGKGYSQALEGFLGDEVMAALENLPVEFKEAIILSDIEGFTYEEISKIAEIPIGTVKSRLYRARGLLQKQLWNYIKDKGYIKDK